MPRRKFEHTVEVTRTLQALEETPSDGEQKCNWIYGVPTEDEPVLMCSIGVFILQ